jgi:hypothetical protein
MKLLIMLGVLVGCASTPASEDAVKSARADEQALPARPGKHGVLILTEQLDLERPIWTFRKNSLWVAFIRVMANDPRTIVDLSVNDEKAVEYEREAGFVTFRIGSGRTNVSIEQIELHRRVASTLPQAVEVVSMVGFGPRGP